MPSPTPANRSNGVVKHIVLTHGSEFPDEVANVRILHLEETIAVDFERALSIWYVADGHLRRVK
jgi:hypothetical protein